MAKKHKGTHHKKHHYAVSHSVKRLSGDCMGFDGLEGSTKTVFNTLGRIALVVFGAAATSFIAKKIPETWPGSKHMKVVAPAALGLAGIQITPKKYRHIAADVAAGGYAVSGVTAMKTYLPGVPLLQGDAESLSIPTVSTMGLDARGRLVDMRDGSLLLDESGNTLNGEGNPHEENLNGNDPGAMLGNDPGAMLGNDENDIFVGVEDEMMG
ncbi:MAG: hypothetical protein WBM07_17165 [Chitinivibrionales bacterium]